MKRYVILKDELRREPDCIIDTEMNILFECCNSGMNKLCKVLNMQDTKWQKLKEWLENQIVDLRKIDIKTKTQCLRVNDAVNCFRQVLWQMQELEGENEKN